MKRELHETQQASPTLPQQRGRTAVDFSALRRLDRRCTTHRMPAIGAPPAAAPRFVPVAVRPRTAHVVAIVPAHNEAEGIVATIRSLRAQVRQVDRIVVTADNCDDDTVALAREAGADVIETVGNTHRKAGAMNQALDIVLPSLREGDVVLFMDADSQLMPDFVGTALRYLADTPWRGAISGSCVANERTGVIALLQRIEYAISLSRVHARGGRITVLCGAACMATVQALRRVAALRGTAQLPGPSGWIYHQESLTEDYELTIAFKRIGYRPLNARDCIVLTDVMPTWKEWTVQRLRWQRGSLETLLMYGWTRHTRGSWVVQCWAYLRSVLPLLVALYWIGTLVSESVRFEPVWVAVVPVMVLDQVTGAWRAGWRGRVCAALLIPVLIYDIVGSITFWRALLRSLRGSEAVWIT